MEKYELSNQAVQNLMVFLDRVPIKGVKEINAMLEIFEAFEQPVSTSDSQEDIEAK